MWIIFILFYNNIIKCRNVDKGGVSPAKWIRFFLHFEAFSMVFWMNMGSLPD